MHPHDSDPKVLRFAHPSEERREPRWLRVCEWLLVALLAAQFGDATLPDAWRTLNTDFPNYYLTATLLHEGFDSSRVYEWLWIERQKDHRELDQRIVGMVPITPFSTLAVYPLTAMPALAAKRCWIVVNLALLVATVFLLRRLTFLSWRRIILIAALSSSMRVNFMYGQYYVLLLFLLTLACWLYLRQRSFLSGVAIGIAAGLKIFPAVFLLYFLRRKDWKAVAGGAVAGLAAAIVSVAAFGWELHRTYLKQVLPATLRGEGLDPFNLSAASLSSLLHRLFIYEPLLNQHPAVNSAWLFAVLLPLLQMAILAPALLLVAPQETSSQRIRLEWAAIVAASLAISTSPGSYLFTLLILPVCIMLEALPAKRYFFFAGLLLVIYLAAGKFSGSNQGFEGWSALLAVPRLWVLVGFCLLAYSLLAMQNSAYGRRRDGLLWAAALGLLVVFSVVGQLRHQRGLYDDYNWRVAAPKDAYMTVHPAVQGSALRLVSMLRDGYHSGVQQNGEMQFSPPSSDDELAVTANSSEHWVERAGRESNVIPSVAARAQILQAESPVASPDGRWLGYLREDHGRGQAWVQSLEHPESPDRPVTPVGMNVLEMSFLPGRGVVFSGDFDGRVGLFEADERGVVRSLGGEEARYPAVSPDGRWLAYSRLEGGSWKLWLQALQGGESKRITEADCNATEPAWEADSKTLVYASDCGRAMWFSVICRRRVVP